MKEEWRNAQHMARPVQSAPTKTTSVLSAYKPFHLRHQEKYSPRMTCRKASLRYMRYTKICNPHVEANPQQENNFVFLSPFHSIFVIYTPSMLSERVSVSSCSEKETMCFVTR